MSDQTYCQDGISPSFRWASTCGDDTIDHHARGAISQEEVATHPQRHFLTGVMGGGASAGSDLHHVMLKLGDAMVICTDGLTGPVRDEEIAEILRTAPSCDDAQVIALFRPPDGFHLLICAIIAT